ncbi:Uncharacterized ABC transporter permease protein YufP [[Clostridium] ultunense Esp]|uniref:ABC transporter permease n=1 Tax=Thermicanus aegyptius TaxID=94009 RepID=UPI0002B6F6DB|nr:ABC transporter permease [Thermicanus aegyptius]CCQ98104.1 Uncharacterized ABC transporter permease protein YufP [[Clostridium] ultunense Esp]
MDKVLRIFSKDSFYIPLIAIILGLLLGALIMLAGGYQPMVAYTSLFNKVFGDLYNIGETVREVTPLILTGLSVAFAFRTGLFNIGASGQMMMGMTGATLIGITVNLPWFLHVPLAILAGGLLGGLWGAIAGYLKAKRGINEVITTIMLNWISLYLSNYIIANYLFDPKNKQRSLYIQDTASISMPWLSNLFNHARMNWGIILALLAAILFYILLWKTKMGYELRAVGFNPHASEYAGINVSRNVMASMFIAGIFSGVAGVIQILGVYHYQTVTAALPSQGFDAIAVALLGGNTPVGVILAAFLFGALNYGSAGMKFGAEVPPEIIRVVIASIIFFIAAHGFIRIFLKPFRKGEKAG